MSLVGLWSSSGSVVISWLVGCGHVLSLWSSSGLVVISWLVVCGHVLGGSVVIFWVCGRFLDRGLLLCPALVCGHLLGLWSFPGSRSVVMSWVSLWSSSGPAVHFLDRGLWSCHKSICGHLLGLWSFPGSWAVVISWVGLCSSSGSVVISWIVG